MLDYLYEQRCEFQGDRYPHGMIWIAPGNQLFMLPDPDFDDHGVGWFDADVLDDNLVNRWVGFTVPLPIRRYASDIATLEQTPPRHA